MAAAATDASWQLRVRHKAVPGRLRLNVRGLRGRYDLCAELTNRLEDRSPIEHVRIDPATGSLLLRYPQEEPATAIEDMVAAALRSVTGASFMPAGVEATPKPVAPGSDDDSPPWHALTAREIVERFGAEPMRGLSAAEARRRLVEHGRNQLPELPDPSELEVLLRQLKSVPVEILAGSAVIAILTGGWVDAMAIAAVVAVNSVIGYKTEWESEQTIRTLGVRPPPETEVVRDGGLTSIASVEVVPGDILALRPGSYITADARVIKHRHLSLDESSLTGESMPVSKYATDEWRRDAPLAERPNVVYQGTSVTGGSGRAVVVATGEAAELGRIHRISGEVEARPTVLQQQLDDLGTQLGIASIAAVAGVFALELLRGQRFVDVVKSAVSLGVAAVPEGLPTVATTTLALGIRSMRRQHVAIRRLPAVEALGSVQVLCLDKTGTLTENRMSAVAVQSDLRKLTVAKGRFRHRGRPIEAEERRSLRRLVQFAALCSEAYDEPESASPTEKALFALAGDTGTDIERFKRRHRRLSTHYRSEKRPYMSTYHDFGRGRVLVIAKGRPEEILKKCDWIRIGARRARLTRKMRQRILTQNRRWSEEALRVLGVAYGRRDDRDSTRLQGLTWLGLVTMTDPVRAGIPELITKLQGAGIRTVMLTGDQAITARQIGSHIGLSPTGDVRVVDIGSTDAGSLDELVGEADVFACVSPVKKLEIVQALQRQGYVVAMTGDGVNDGPALRAADIGIAMGSAPQDVARLVADVILEDDRLGTLLNAVAQGRTTYGNIRKALHYLLSTNLSEIQVMLAAAVLGLPPPLYPLELLWINFVTDVFPALALAVEPPEPDVLSQPPRSPREPVVRREDWKRLLRESALISTGTLASFGYAFARYGPGKHANTLAFSTLTMAQLLHAYTCRSDRYSAFRRDGLQRNSYLDVAIGASVVAQLGTLFVPPLRRLLGATPITVLDAAVITGGALAPLFLNEWMKPGAAAQRGADGGRERPTPQPQTVISL